MPVVRNGKRHLYSFNGVSGLSDIVACVRGRMVVIEVKRPGKKPTDMQEAFLQRVRDAGGVALVITSVEQLVEQVSPLLAARG